MARADWPIWGEARERGGRLLLLGACRLAVGPDSSPLISTLIRRWVDSWAGKAGRAGRGVLPQGSRW